MKNCYITFRSVTPAQRGEGMLRRDGIDCMLSRTPRWMEQQGCGYCLRLRQSQAARAVQLLRGGGVHYQRVYLLREDGTAEELMV